MEKTRVIIMLAFALTQCFNIQAQIMPTEIFKTSDKLTTCWYFSDDEIILTGSNQNRDSTVIIQTNISGELLLRKASTPKLMFYNVYKSDDGQLLGLAGSEKNCLSIGMIDDNLFFNETGNIPYENTFKLLCFRSSDGTFALRYINTAIGKTRIVRFNEMGEVLAERWFDVSDPYQLFISDETGDGYYFVYKIENGTGKDIRYDCYKLDSDLNAIPHHQDVYKDFPLHGFIASPYVTRHPYNYNVYVAGDISFPPYNGNPEVVQDVLIAKFDSEFNYQNMQFGMAAPTNDQPTFGKSIEFLSDGSMLMCAMMGNMGMVNDFYIGHFDTNLNKCEEVFYHSDEMSTMPYDFSVTNEGGCIILTNGFDNVGSCSAIFHIPVEAFLGVEEAHASGLRVAVAYPNPGGGEMRLRTTVEDAEGVVYDMNGRLVARQPLTQTETSFDATQWPSGTYLWNVTAHGKTVESGKWVKE